MRSLVNTSLLFLLLLLLSPLPALAQQDALFSQHMYNQLEFNPASAGSSETFAFDLLSRFQWVGIEGAPKTVTFSAQTPLRNRHIGLGMYVYYDKTGPTVDYNIMGSFSYRILFPSSRLCFGISAGIKYYDIDWSALDPKDAGDLLLNDQVRNRAVPDADLGIYYYGKSVFAGISSKHLLQNQMVVSSTSPEDEASFTRLLRNFYGIAGGYINLSGNIVFSPSVLFKFVRNAPLQADVSARFIVSDLVTFGISYRTEKAICLLACLDLRQGFSFGYSCDIWFNSLYGLNKGSHEIRLGYRFEPFARERMLTPRYF